MSNRICFWKNGIVSAGDWIFVGQALDHLVPLQSLVHDLVDIARPDLDVE
jgi:hypothetical protein